MKKLLSLVILLGMGITIYAQQPCIECTGTTASGDHATSVGAGTNANDDNSFAGGYSTTANGDNSFAFGANSTVNGDGSIGLGLQSNTLQEGGIAIGKFVTANELNSYVFGRGTSSVSPLVNNKPNSLMFGVSHLPTLTIVKPTGGADLGYLGIGTEEPTEMAHVVGTHTKM
jgi:hypothetical protein